MTRRHLTFPCEGASLVGTLDNATGTAGLLIVSGGNEVRSGAFAGQARLAASLASRGYPVFRFDRRGVGDSSGTNAGFHGSRSDIEAAVETFRRECSHVSRLVAFGNCDAASALMLWQGCGAHALVLANPWTFDEGQAETTPSTALKARYRQKLGNPRELARLLTGKVSLRGVARDLGKARKASGLTRLGAEMAERMASFRGDTRILLAGRDRTAQAFRSHYPLAGETVLLREGADHAFSEPADRDWLEQQIVGLLECQS
ncbi:hydrolase 1, exosortase A system-associated [Aurantiacibacter hainanensis]|uniref:hydrolase 1, exosortase A system-associated n=1 Tax=Aurantiacibacter hainanensis TaxID=3076114 RepID=UPI0030C683FD